MNDQIVPFVGKYATGWEYIMISWTAKRVWYGERLFLTKGSDEKSYSDYFWYFNNVFLFYY